MKVRVYENGLISYTSFPTFGPIKLWKLALKLRFNSVKSSLNFKVDRIFVQVRGEARILFVKPCRGHDSDVMSFACAYKYLHTRAISVKMRFICYIIVLRKLSQLKMTFHKV